MSTHGVPLGTETLIRDGGVGMMTDAGGTKKVMDRRNSGRVYLPWHV
jgi:hypothetical protein